MAAMRAPESIDAIRQRRHDHRTVGDELQMELTVRKAEALVLVANAQPHLNRLEMVAAEFGPTTLASVTALRAMLDRFSRQWTDPQWTDPEGTAA